MAAALAMAADFGFGFRMETSIRLGLHQQGWKPRVSGAKQKLGAGMLNAAAWGFMMQGMYFGHARSQESRCPAPRFIRFYPINRPGMHWFPYAEAGGIFSLLPCVHWYTLSVCKQIYCMDALVSFRNSLRSARSCMLSDEKLRCAAEDSKKSNAPEHGAVSAVTRQLSG